MSAQRAALYHCLSCGRVVRATPETTDAPQCCGNSMVIAETDTVSERDFGEQEAARHCETKPPVIKGRLKPH